MRLLSWNIHKGIGGRDRRYSLQRIIDCIDHEQPDIVCLQEVDRLVRRSQFDDQPRLLARSLGLHAVFQSNVPVGSGSYGNLVLSRFPVGSRHRISLKRGLRKSRGAQLVLIEPPAGHPCRQYSGGRGLSAGDKSRVTLSQLSRLAAGWWSRQGIHPRPHRHRAGPHRPHQPRANGQ
jgi:endonuclease/exonuclease/phosphatase family metal-dependent hydrolase